MMGGVTPTSSLSPACLCRVSCGCLPAKEKEEEGEGVGEEVAEQGVL